MIKRLIALIIIFLGLYYIYDNNLFSSRQLVRDIRKEIYLPATNEYVKKDVKNSFVKNTNDFVPDNKQELLDIYYTVVNNGWDSFTFYCNYDKCIEDVNEISTNGVLLSNINSFVSTYNQYDTISTYTTPLLNAKVNIVIKRTYDDYMIKKTNEQIDAIYKELDLDNKDIDIEEQIKTVHDYIINNSKYDDLKIDNIEDNTYFSNTAYGPLFQGYAVCSGYTDAMALFLDKMNIPNIKVASATHIWNLVYLNDEWYHLDLTWDDPYTEDSTNIISHNFFLIDYEKLKAWNTEEHIFDQNIYREAL
ncbi:MAG TPA: hypothetical protein GXZ95_04345 [Mollicutes bacterium]|nr:hypothetical protein [Mollicutes bacterium]